MQNYKVCHKHHRSYIDACDECEMEEEQNLMPTVKVQSELDEYAYFCRDGQWYRVSYETGIAEQCNRAPDAPKCQHITDAAAMALCLEQSEVLSHQNEFYASRGVMVVTVEEWDCWTDANLRIQDMGRELGDLEQQLAERDAQIATLRDALVQETRRHDAEIAKRDAVLQAKKDQWAANVAELERFRLPEKIPGTVADWIVSQDQAVLGGEGRESKHGNLLTVLPADHKLGGDKAR